MMTERDIVKGCKRGAPSAQREFFDRYSPHLMSVIHRYIVQDDVSQDVLQESFIAAFENIGSFKYSGEGSLKAWLTRIAVNHALNELRSSKRLAATSLEVETMPGVALVAEPSFNEMQELSAATILQEVEQLPIGYRTVFNLYCLDGYSHREIARELGINEKSSSSQLARAKQLLAKRLREIIDTQNMS